MPRGAPTLIPPPPTTILGEALTARQQALFTADAYNGLVRGYAPQLVDAFLLSRPGLLAIGDTLNEQVNGSISVRDADGQQFLIVGTPLKWWSFNNTTLLWANITGTALVGANTQPVIFAFWQLTSTQIVIGTNRADLPRQFNLTGTAYTTLSNAPRADSVAIVANRAVFARTVEAGVKFPSRARWSAAGDQTTYPAGAFVDVGDTADQAVAVRALGRRAGAFYKEHSQWILNAVARASDANAFEVLMLDKQPGPMGAAAIDDGPGGLTHVYLGLDGNLYLFDGVRVSLLAWTSEKIAGDLAFASSPLTCVKYFPREQEVWVLVPLGADVLPTNLLIYSVKTGGIYLEKLGVALSHLGSYFAETQTIINSLPDVVIDNLPNIPIDQLGLTTTGTKLTAGSATKMFEWSGATDDGTAITVDWQWALPVLDGEEYEIDGVEAIFRDPGSDVTVTISVKLGSTWDNLVETTLGTINPNANETTVPPAGTPPTLPASGALRGRVAVVRILVTASVALRLRRLEVWGWHRKLAVG